MRNHATYLVEGKAGLGVMLGESVEDLRRRLGLPDYRDYERIERLYYRRETFWGSFLVYRSRIVQIRLEVRRSIESFQFFTALGFRYSNIIRKQKPETMRALKKFYARAHALETKNCFDVFMRGIRFQFPRVFKVALIFQLVWLVAIVAPIDLGLGSDHLLIPLLIATP